MYSVECNLVHLTTSITTSNYASKVYWKGLRYLLIEAISNGSGSRLVNDT